MTKLKGGDKKNNRYGRNSRMAKEIQQADLYRKVEFLSYKNNRSASNLLNKWGTELDKGKILRFKKLTSVAEWVGTVYHKFSGETGWNNEGMIRYYLKLAELGYDEAYQHIYGNRYSTFKQDNSLKIIEEIAEKENSGAAYAIAGYLLLPTNEYVIRSRTLGGRELSTETFDEIISDPNNPKMLEYFKKSVELKAPLGMYHMALMYESGFLVEKNIPTAIELYKKVEYLEKDNFDKSNYGIKAKYYLAHLYHNLPDKFEEAIYWYCRTVTYRLENNGEYECNCNITNAGSEKEKFLEALKWFYIAQSYAAIRTGSRQSPSFNTSNIPKDQKPSKKDYTKAYKESKVFLKKYILGNNVGKNNSEELICKKLNQ